MKNLLMKNLLMKNLMMKVNKCCPLLYLNQVSVCIVLLICIGGIVNPEFGDSEEGSNDDEESLDEESDDEGE